MMSSQAAHDTLASAPPAYGKRLVPEVVDTAARETPDREVFQVPRSENPSDGWEVITFRQYANAVNRCCHTIVEQCGKAPEGTFPTIAYIGPNDARYLVIMVAAVKTGYKALFISPRNTLEAQVNLFDKTDCRFVAYPESYRTIVSPWLEVREMKSIHVPSVEDWLSNTEVPHYPYNKTFEQAQWDPYVVLHTSGSTGLPKPIVCRQGGMAIADAHHLLPDWEGYKPIFRAWAEKSKRCFLPMPLFHAAGSFLCTVLALYWGIPVVLGNAHKQLSADVVKECLANTDAGFTVLPPSILEDLSRDETGTEQLARLDFVAFGGGSLAQESGDKLSRHGVTLQNMIAATETAPFPLYYNGNPENWPYFIYNTELLGGEWRKVGDDDVYDQVIVRQGKEPGLQTCFYTYPELNEYPTNDLYSPHPTMAHHWRHVGRSDNIIVFSNGEKLNPVSIELLLEADPRIRSALVVGTGRFQSALIIEPSSHPHGVGEEQRFIEDIWPLVVAANKDTVAHGHLDRGLVTLSDPSKPFPRSGKGTVQRAAAVKSYEQEIDQIYENSAQETFTDVLPLDITTEDALIRSIAAIFESQLETAGLQPNTDFFSAGVDSMQVIGISRKLQAAIDVAGFGGQAAKMTPGAINSHPTPRKLSHYVMQTIVRGEDKTDAKAEALEQERDMQALHEKFTNALLVVKTERPNPAEEEQTVVLTGSTGMLGSYMLDAMVRSSRVKKIICLNRAQDGGASQQLKSMEDRGLDMSFSDKAEFHHINASQPKMGLTESLYARLLADADRFIHNAWPVNFHMPVKSFEDQLQGVRNIADLAATATKRVEVIFISSIGTILGWDPLDGPVPESRLERFSLAAGGYGQSKMVASLILDDASTAANFPAVSVRVGQIAGPDAGNGVWNRHEWFPSIVASSLHMKALPADLGNMMNIDWTPVERIANMVLEIGGVTQEDKPEALSSYYHGVNPSVTDWQTLAQAIVEFYGKEKLPEMVTFKEWVARLENTAPVEGNPGIKLLDHYRGMNVGGHSSNGASVMDIERTVKHSPTLRNSKAITPELMKQWCTNWRF